MKSQINLNFSDCESFFDEVNQSHPFCTLYVARWDGEKERFGVIDIETYQCVLPEYDEQP